MISSSYFLLPATEIEMETQTKRMLRAGSRNINGDSGGSHILNNARWEEGRQQREGWICRGQLDTEKKKNEILRARISSIRKIMKELSSKRSLRQDEDYDALVS